VSKIIAYTCITAGRDSAVKINREPGVDYVMFTDQAPQNDFWEYKGIHESQRNDDPRRTARYFKVNPHLLFPGYDYSIWLDGNIEPLKPVQWYIEKLNGKDIAVHAHPKRNCAYEEAALIRRLKFDYPKKVDAIVGILEADRYPRNHGLAETFMLVRRHCAELARANDYWWSLIAGTSRRDQLSFNYAFWKSGCAISTLPEGSVAIHPHLTKNRRVID